MATKPPTVFTPRLPNSASIVVLRGPFSGTHTSIPVRIHHDARHVTLACYCEEEVIIYIEQRYVARWRRTQTLIGKQLGSKIKSAGGAYDLRIMVVGVSVGLVEVVQ